MTTYRLLALVFLVGIGGLVSTQASTHSSLAAPDEAELWQLLRNGEAVALMRHALAPGTGDPADFTPGVCSTQRNLSDEGRQQASAIGERFRRNGIEQAQVYSSRWCRCLDTAEMLNLGAVQPFNGLNSFFRDRSTEPAQTEATQALINRLSVQDEPPLVLVTHQVNITALTGVFPSSGEIIVLEPAKTGPQVVGRIKNP